jgi:hypothetical protein
MTEFAIGVAVGLVLGWNFLPQPKVIRDFFAKWKKTE